MQNLELQLKLTVGDLFSGEKAILTCDKTLPQKTFLADGQIFKKPFYFILES